MEQPLQFTTACKVCQIPSMQYVYDIVDNTDAIKTEYRTLGEVMEFFPKNSKHQAYLYMEKRQKELLNTLVYGTK
jgi:hypothetical protein